MLPKYPYNFITLVGGRLCGWGFFPHVVRGLTLGGKLLRYYEIRGSGRVEL